jgi:hypothetical protein
MLTVCGFINQENWAYASNSEDGIGLMTSSPFPKPVGHDCLFAPVRKDELSVEECRLLMKTQLVKLQGDHIRLEKLEMKL